MGTSSGEFLKYSKFETYQECMGIYGDCFGNVWVLIGNLGKCEELHHIQT